MLISRSFYKLFLRLFFNFLKTADIPEKPNSQYIFNNTKICSKTYCKWSYFDNNYLLNGPKA